MQKNRAHRGQLAYATKEVHAEVRDHQVLLCMQVLGDGP
jgi:hypothetical protein